MNKMTLSNNKEFNVESIMDLSGVLEITFGEGTTYEEVARVYDASLNDKDYSVEALRKFTIESEGEIQGTHIGYTDVINIMAFNGVIKVQIAKEDELKSEVELIKQENAELREILNHLLKMNGVSAESILNR